MNAIVNAAFNGVGPSGVFAGLDAGDDLSGGITGGYGMIRYKGKVWAIHYRQQELPLMRPDGDGPKGSIDIIILKANANLSKTWYENGWDETSTNPPDCASANGVVPDQGVPKKQSNVCGTCPRNQWNTAPNGGKGKACGDHRRLAVVPLMDIPNEAFGGPMLLRCPAASLQDLSAFDQKYKQQGYPYFAIGVKVSFDVKESYPKFIFEAIRPLTDDEARKVLALRSSHEVSRVISETTVAAPVEPTPEKAAFLEAAPGAPVSTVVAAQVTAQPVQQPVQPVAAAQPAVAQPTQPVGQQPAAPPAAAEPATAVAQPVAAKAVVMTGFGAAVAATPAGNQSQAASPVREPVAEATKVADAAFDASLDDKLAALIGN